MELVNRIKLRISEFVRNSSIHDSGYAENIAMEGYCVVEDFLSVETCELLERKALDLFKLGHPSVRMASNGFDQRFFGVEFYDDSFMLPKMEETARDTFSDLIKVKEYGYTYMLNKIHAGKGNLGSGEGWHRDSPLSPQFKAILYITDVNSDNGPFQYVPKTHTYKGILDIATLLNTSIADYRYKDLDIEKILDAGYEMKSFTAKKGTLLLADTRGIHRGKVIEMDYRIALTRYGFYRRPSDTIELDKLNFL